jgi:hypothetical protein
MPTFDFNPEAVDVMSPVELRKALKYELETNTKLLKHLTHIRTGVNQLIVDAKATGGLVCVSDLQEILDKNHD